MHDLLEKLKSQHAEMAVILDKTASRPPERCGQIIEDLNAFKKIFVDHLYLENNFLYPVLLEKEKRTKVALLNAEIFLKEMADIQNSTVAFLNKYAAEDKIRGDFAGFKEALAETAKILKTRIQLEEECLFELF